MCDVCGLTDRRVLLYSVPDERLADVDVRLCDVDATPFEAILPPGRPVEPPVPKPRRKPTHRRRAQVTTVEQIEARKRGGA